MSLETSTDLLEDTEDTKILSAFHSTKNPGNYGWEGEWNGKFPE